MQKNINIATSFKPGNVSDLVFSCLVVNSHGKVGQYWCAAKNLEDAETEAIAAVEQYKNSVFWDGVEIDHISMSEKMPSGNSVSRGQIDF